MVKRSLRARLTEKYEKKIQETKETRAAEGTATVLVQSGELDIEKVGETVTQDGAQKKDPVQFADAPKLTLKDLVPLDETEQGEKLDDAIQVSKIEFIMMARPTVMPMQDEGHEWDMPTQDQFEAAFGKALDEFTDIDINFMNVI